MNQPATRQLTFRAVLLAVILAMVLAAANAYLGLFAGLTIATAIPAAVVSMGVLRLLGGGTILENNIVQTGASAGSSIAAGVIFTIPALIILGYWQDFRSEEHTSELQSLMRISYAVFCLKKKNTQNRYPQYNIFH